MYSTGKMTDATGATGRQLATWASKGWLSSTAPGTGRTRMWSQSDMDTASMIMRFVKVGFTVDKAAQFTRIINRRQDNSRGVRIKLEDQMWLIVKGIE